MEYADITIDLEKVLNQFVKLQKTQIQQLLNLTYASSQDYIINEDDKEVLTEVISLLRQYSFADVYSFLTTVNSPDDIIWGQPVYQEAQNRINKDIFIQLYPSKGSKQHGKCKFCAHDELLVTRKQLRSGDEPMSVFLTCPRCKNMWSQK